MDHQPKVKKERKKRYEDREAYQEQRRLQKLESVKNWQKNNADRVLAYIMKTWKCPCGATVRVSSKTGHLRSRTHAKKMAEFTSR